ncbi:hypothetical protein [Nocardia vinacea]|uniref:hypothetical protein n=1 Tax=Nocardia vinacea TaxID=96468 RepID=UPI0002DD0497|nr:hypothetical protein [Nocardia vinacea]
MTIEDKVAQQVRAVRTSLRKLLAKPDEDSRRRTDIGGKHPNDVVERISKSLRDAFKR